MPKSYKNLTFVSATTLATVALTASGSAHAAQYFVKPTLNTYVNISAELSVQHEDTLLPAQPNFDFVGSGGLLIQRGVDGQEYVAEVFVQDPLNQLVEAKVVAEAPREGDFLAEVKLVDSAGESFDLFISPDKVSLPTVIESSTSFNNAVNVNAGVDYEIGSYKLGGAISFEASDLRNSNATELGSALLYVGSDKYGTLRLGKNLSLPISTVDPRVISGGSFSFADFGDWQVSYVSPIWSGFRAGVLAGKGDDGKFSFAGSAQYQYTRGDHQFRLGGYADTSKSWQGLAGYTYRYAPEGFGGITARYGRDGGLESFASLEATLQHRKHFVSAGIQRVWSNNLDLLYANNDNAFFSVSVRDTSAFNREDRFSLGYSYTYNRNLQLFANAQVIRHKFYDTRKEFGAGVRIAF